MKQAKYQRTIPLREGAVTLRLVVRDTTSGHSGSLTVALKEIKR